MRQGRVLDRERNVKSRTFARAITPLRAWWNHRLRSAIAYRELYLAQQDDGGRAAFLDNTVGGGRSPARTVRTLFHVEGIYASPHGDNQLRELARRRCDRRQAL